jgi:8-oxo-dGTP pyrophosphatase MutT (NUDIX family)
VESPVLQPPPQPFDDQLRARLAGNLAGFDRVGAQPIAGQRHAAVAVMVVGDADGRGCFLLTRRAGRLRSHTGQWALPGGRVDPGETAEQAAARELAEELGVVSGEVLGLLDDYVTRSGYRITPVVLWGTADPALVPNPDEVAEAHVVGLEELGPPRFVSIPESDRPVIQMPLRGSLVHAPTGAVLHQFAEVALGGRQTRVAGFEQPVFAWR